MLDDCYITNMLPPRDLVVRFAEMSNQRERERDGPVLFLRRISLHLSHTVELHADRPLCAPCNGLGHAGPPSVAKRGTAYRPP